MPRRPVCFRVRCPQTGSLPAPNPTIGLTSMGVYDRVDVYDIACGVWLRGPTMTVPRHGIFPAVDAGTNRLYVYGGSWQKGYGMGMANTVLQL